MLCGRETKATEQAVVVERKQWDRCQPAEPDKLVRSWVGGGEREILHPPVQVGQYRQYLEDTHSAFHEGATPIQLSACCYLHNYVPAATDPILAGKFEGVLRATPVFDACGA